MRPRDVMALQVDDVAPETLTAEQRAYFAKCQEKLGFLPNVLLAHAFDAAKLQNFVNLYNELMLAESELSRLDRELIAVAVSARNRCHYCLVSHGQAVRELSGDPMLGEAMVMNYRVAALSPRQRIMIDFCVKLTGEPESVDEPDRDALRDAGYSERGIWDIVATASFYAMSNRLAIGAGMVPNAEYHVRSR